MVISSTLACFHSSPPLPSCHPSLLSSPSLSPPLMMIGEGLNGVIPQRSLGEKIRDRCIVINVALAFLRKSNSKAGDMNGNVVSFVMCANAIYGGVV